jgi:hypothetical protein
MPFKVQVAHKGLDRRGLAPSTGLDPRVTIEDCCSTVFWRPARIALLGLARRSELHMLEANPLRPEAGAVEVKRAQAP